MLDGSPGRFRVTTTEVSRDCIREWYESIGEADKVNNVRDLEKIHKLKYLKKLEH